MLLAFIVSLGVEAKKVKLSKNIVYEGAVQNGEPNGKGCLKVYSCLDKIPNGQLKTLKVSKLKMHLLLILDVDVT